MLNPGYLPKGRRLMIVNLGSTPIRRSPPASWGSAFDVTGCRRFRKAHKVLFVARTRGEADEADVWESNATTSGKDRQHRYRSRSPDQVHSYARLPARGNHVILESP